MPAATAPLSRFLASAGKRGVSRSFARRKQSVWARLRLSSNRFLSSQRYYPTTREHRKKPLQCLHCPRNIDRCKPTSGTNQDTFPAFIYLTNGICTVHSTTRPSPTASPTEQDTGIVTPRLPRPTPSTRSATWAPGRCSLRSLQSYAECCCDCSNRRPLPCQSAVPAKP